MAQMGSYVPAREANIGMVDRLFTRVGASDNLAGGESTFMVEMTEAANILNNATDRSLVLFDEIGRGTATFDGLSLAWAITEHLHNTPKSLARTVFATHYHELTELADQLDRVSNFNVAVKESGDKIIFLRKIKPGPCDKSYGIHVAQMAGLPQEVISRASEILKKLILHEPLQKSDVSLDPTDQMDLFNIQESQLRKALTEMDTDQMTPMEALANLAQIKKDHGL
jgi:DNA mismatch repair protein MutS